jgi:hypothetical protein
MPLMLEKMVSYYPFAFYMFIPAQFVREAFGVMVVVFKKQEKRIQWWRQQREGGIGFSAGCPSTF